MFRYKVGSRLRHVRRGALLAMLVLALTGGGIISTRVSSSATTSACYSTSSVRRNCNFFYNALGTFPRVEVIVIVNAAAAYSGVTTFSANAGADAWDITMYVQQCDGLGHNCSTMSANSGAGKGGGQVETGSKIASRGHTYRSCATVHDASITPIWSLVAVCSPYIPY
jgi:hypothetical protein